MFGRDDDFLNIKYDIPNTKNESNRNEEIELLNEFRKKIPKLLKQNFEKYAKHANKKKI